MPSDESKGSQLDAIGSLAQRQLDNTFSFDLLYSTYPKWATYDQLLKLSDQLLERLRPLGARDLIDVQSFMWVVGGSPYMKKVKRKL